MATGCSKTVSQPSGPATKLAYAVEPSNASANHPITPAIQVAIQDASGNTVRDFTGSVTVSIGSNPVNGALSGTKTTSVSNGIASFSDLSIDRAGDGYTLDATAVGLAGMTSGAFNVACITNCWSAKALMPTTRAWFGVGALNGIIYAVGGYGETLPDTGILGTVEAYDPSTNSWTAKAPLQAPRMALAVGVVNGVLYAVGGLLKGGGSTGTVEAYDPTTNTWTTKAPMPTARLGLNAAVVNGRLYAMGGSGYATVEAYDPLSDSWATKDSMPTARAYFGTAVANGVIYVFGGEGLLGPAQSTGAYDPVANTWTSRPQMPIPVYGPGAETLNGFIYAVGGSDSIFRSSLQRYDPATNAWTMLPPMFTARDQLSVGLVNGILYAIGGRGPNNASFGANEAYHP